jgi:predicted PurR-regulated permease PerM
MLQLPPQENSVPEERQATDMSQWLLLAAITGIALYLTWQMLSPFVDVLIWAVVLVIVFYPVHQRVLARVRRPGLAALGSLLIVLITVMGPLVTVSTAVVAQLSSLAAEAPETVQVWQAKAQNVLAHPEQYAIVKKAMDRIRPYVKLQDLLSRENITSVANRASQILVQSSVGVVGGALGFVGKAFFVLFTMFYLFRDAPAAVAALQDVLPMRRDRGAALLHHIREVINASVYGVVAIAVVQGLLGGLMFWLLGARSAVLLGVLMALLSMVPVVGGALVWVPVVLVFALTGAPGKAAVLTAWCVLVVGTADNVLRPRLVGGRTQMHELLIFFSVLGGLQVFGMVGLLVGPVVFAVTRGLLAVFREEAETSPPADQSVGGPRDTLPRESAADAGPAPAAVPPGP